MLLFKFQFFLSLVRLMSFLFLISTLQRCYAEIQGFHSMVLPIKQRYWNPFRGGVWLSSVSRLLEVVASDQKDAKNHSTLVEIFNSISYNYPANYPLGFRKVFLSVSFSYHTGHTFPKIKSKYKTKHSLGLHGQEC